MYQKLEPVKATFQLSRLLSESESDISVKLADALKYIGEITGVDRVYLAGWRASEKTITTVAQWCTEQLDPMPNNPITLGDLSILDEYFQQNAGMFSVQRELVIFENKLVGILCLEARHPDTNFGSDEHPFISIAARLLAPYLKNIPLPIHSEEIPVGGSQVNTSSERVDENAPALLIVEDNKINQNSMSRLWQHLGVHAQLADDGFEALALCRERKFDLILMDLSMPEKDGFDTSREILTSCPNNKNTPIVAVTANVGDGVEARCLKVGMKEYVSKPIRLDSVRDLFERYFSN